MSEVETRAGSLESSALSVSLSDRGRRAKAPPIAALMNLSLAKPELISLAAGFTDNPSLPLEIVRETLNDLLSEGDAGRAALQYGSTPGCPQLREISARRLAAADGAERAGPYDAARTLITTGSQQYLYLLCEALLDPGDIVLVEDPSYFVALGTMVNSGVRLHGVETDEAGLVPESLDAVLARMDQEGELRRLKALYLVTYFQNPSGVTTTLERKAVALEILQSYESKAGRRLLLIEDAAYRDLRFAGPDVPSALTLPGADQHVVYTSTYSKPFSTGVRVGFGIAPQRLWEALNHLKANHDFGTPSLNQALMRRVLEQGLFDEYLETLRVRYAKKAAIMGQALEVFAPPELEYDTPKGGLYYWAHAPEGLVTSMGSPFFQAVFDRNTVYVPGDLCFAEDPWRPRPANGMRLSFGGASDDQIPEGIRRLSVALKEFGG